MECYRCTVYRDGYERIIDASSPEWAAIRVIAAWCHHAAEYSDLPHITVRDTKTHQEYVFAMSVVYQPDYSAHPRDKDPERPGKPASAILAEAREKYTEEG